ncbi:MAG: hypothetical protein HQ581_10295, partial [Planctomycetes bacterium]|nr:hypothetical protein [Planctomycetota bacterium]
MQTSLIYLSTTLALLAGPAPEVSSCAAGQDEAEDPLPYEDPNIVLNLLPEKWYGEAPKVRPKRGFEPGATPVYV